MIAREVRVALIYLCAGCDQHHCADCEGGQDACPICQLGPLCDDCAAEHAADEREAEAREDRA